MKIQQHICFGAAWSSLNLGRYSGPFTKIAFTPEHTLIMVRSGPEQPVKTL